MHPDLNVETCFTINFRDIEKLIKKLYGIEYSITQEYDHLYNTSFIEFTIDGEHELDTTYDDVIYDHWISTGDTVIDILDIDDYWNDSGKVELRHYLHRMFLAGHLDSGKYTILIDY